MTTKKKPIKPKEKLYDKDRCSAYGDDCKYVPNPVACFIGNKECGIADGYCPLIHSKN